MKRLFLLGAFCLVAVVVGGLFAAREVASDVSETPSFSVGRSGPSNLSPADIFNLGPLVSIPCAGLGLAATGDCIAGGNQDNVDALSYGMDFTVAARSGKWLFFSVAPGSTGLGGTAVNGEANCATAEPEADEFASAANGANSQYYDGNGLACGANLGGPIGLMEAQPAVPHNDNLDALDEFPVPQIHYGGGGGPGMVWFSLDPASPSLPNIGGGGGATPGDILLALVGGGAPMRWATVAQLGLMPGDDIDALCIKEGASPVDYYRPGVDLVWLSLVPLSPTLTAKGWSAADVIQAGLPVTRWKTAGQLGLNASDNLDALKCLIEPEATPTPTATNTPMPTNTPTPTRTPGAVGGIAELPDLAGSAGDQAAASDSGSGWSSAGYAALAGGLAAAAVLLSAGVWYARRRLLR